MNILDKLNLEMQYSGSIDKTVTVYCPKYKRKETVYFVLTQYPQPFGYVFNACEQNCTSACMEQCRLRAEAEFKEHYSQLPLLSPSSG